MNNDIVKPLYYEVYLQDTRKPYLELIPIGYVKTLEEAKNVTKMFRDCIERNPEQNGQTVFFRAVIKKQ